MINISYVDLNNISNKNCSLYFYSVVFGRFSSTAARLCDLLTIRKYCVLLLLSQFKNTTGEGAARHELASFAKIVRKNFLL